MSVASNAPTEQQVQEDLLRLDAYRNQLGGMLQQQQYLLASRLEHQRAREALEGLERSGDGADLLIPIGGETFVRARPAGGPTVLLGIGGGVVAELERTKATEVLAQRLSKLDDAANEIEGQVRTLEERVTLLSRRLDAIGRAAEGGSSDDVGGD